MHHLAVDRWSRGDSFLHNRDGRAKLAALFLYLVCLATEDSIAFPITAWYAAFPVAGIAAARLPLAAVAARAALLLPFAATFAGLSLLAGDVPRAVSLLVKSGLSALAVMAVVATTPMPKLLRAAEGLGAPRLFTLIVHFLFRYLFVIAEKVQHMRMAAACRGGFRRQAAAGAVAVLFGSSYARAEGIHRAMAARGFAGHFPTLAVPRAGWLDLFFLATLAALWILPRFQWTT